MLRWKVVNHTIDSVGARKAGAGKLKVQWLVVWALMAIFACQRSTRENPVELAGHSLVSPRSQENVRALIPSVVGIAAVFDYRLEFFEHELVNGQFVPEATSPTGYRLLKNAGAVTSAKKIQKVNGGGIIIYRDGRQTVILTCEHVLSSPDTVRTFYRDANGNETKIMLSRAIKKRATHHVIDQANHLEPAEILHTDSRTDLGLVTVTTKMAVGEPFTAAVAYKNEVRWGDLAFVFGYPREIKQLTMGIVSPAPYPGSFSLDVVGRYGFSGGPVFVVRPGGELELAGIVRGVPVSKIKYLQPPLDMQPGQNLRPDEINQITADEYDLIEYGTVYAIGTERIGRFFQESKAFLQTKGIILSDKLLPP
ncbi:MAG: hypothetical protein ALAOOOJD_00227 [bacterium]|nr:hypothetical protein [bacterium]